MNAVKYIGKAIGRCATEYSREDLDSILPRYNVFLYRDQMVGLPEKLESKPFGAVNSRFHMPFPGFGVYGREADGTFTLLASCIDSSD